MCRGASRTLPGTPESRDNPTTALSATDAGLDVPAPAHPLQPRRSVAQSCEQMQKAVPDRASVAHTPGRVARAKPRPKRSLPAIRAGSIVKAGRPGPLDAEGGLAVEDWLLSCRAIRLYPGAGREDGEEETHVPAHRRFHHRGRGIGGSRARQPAH